VAALAALVLVMGVATVAMGSALATLLKEQHRGPGQGVEDGLVEP
jgi:hypothetical protein